MKTCALKILVSALVAVMILSGCIGSPDKPASVTTSAIEESVAVENATKESAADSDDAATADTVSVTDQSGREVLIGGEVNRIVSGYYISSSACIALGLEDKLAGIEAKAKSRPIYALSAPQLLDLPDVGTAKEFNLEGCIALEPDLVILPLRLRDSADAMAELGIPVILVDPEDREKLVEMITLIGAATGTEEAADKLISYYTEELSKTAALTAGLTEKPNVYMCGNSSYLTAAPAEMYQATLIEAAGGINAVGGLQGDSWVEVSYEQLLAIDPDVFIIPAEAAYGREDIISDAQLSGLTAVKEGKVYQMPRDFEAWDSPVPSCVLGTKWMLSVLHEDVYSMQSMKENAAAFYKEFYNAEIDTDLIGK